MTEPQPQQQKKKGLHPLAWVAIGCGGLILVGFIMLAVGGMFVFNKAKDVVESFEENPAKAAAEMMVRINPEIEKVSSDDAAGTMTIRDKESGETVTLNFDDIAEGRFSFETSEGSFSIEADGDAGSGGIRIRGGDGEEVRIGGGADAGQLPEWVPLYPGSSPQATFTGSGGQGEGGFFTFETRDAPKEVLDYFNDRLRSAGYEVTRQTVESSSEQGFAGNVNGTHPEGRTVNVTAARDGGKSQVTVAYSSDG